MRKGSPGGAASALQAVKDARIPPSAPVGDARSALTLRGGRRIRSMPLATRDKPGNGGDGRGRSDGRRRGRPSREAEHRNHLFDALPASVDVDGHFDAQETPLPSGKAAQPTGQPEQDRAPVRKSTTMSPSARPDRLIGTDLLVAFKDGHQQGGDDSQRGHDQGHRADGRQQHVGRKTRLPHLLETFDRRSGAGPSPSAAFQPSRDRSGVRPARSPWRSRARRRRRWRAVVAR